MPIATIDGVDLYYERHGDAGEPLVLVHGYTGDLTDWRHQLPEFAPTHRVLIMDLRGHGKSSSPPDRASYTIDRMSREVEALIVGAGFERFHLVGHSMGGAISQELTLRSPGRILSLTLHDTGHNFARNEAMAKFNQARNKIAEEQGMAKLASIPSPFPKMPYATDERKVEESERFARMSVDGFIGAGAGLQSWAGTADRLAQIAAPTMVIYGELDWVGLVDAAKHIAATIPDAVLESVPQAGHSPQFERPELFNAALRRHLDRNAGASAK